LISCAKTPTPLTLTKTHFSLKLKEGLQDESMVLAERNEWEKSITEEELGQFLKELENLEHSKWILRSITTLVNMSQQELERLDWKIITGTLQDLSQGFKLFHPYRHRRKVAIFGSARIPPENSEYQFAVQFARRLAEAGFMVLTGGGGGIMQAGNEGATREHSFGLNIQLPFEQGANPYIMGDEKSLHFKYFFTRKLFFLRESDAVALFPGGFGTQDEAYETLTLCQTGKYGPAPLVLIDEPGGNYWQNWQKYAINIFLSKGLISPQDTNLYTITDNLDVACETISNFYRVYHSSRYVGEELVIRLNSCLSDEQLEELNQNYHSILVSGKIRQIRQALPEEQGDETEKLPRLVLNFNQKNQGKLYQMIWAINNMELADSSTCHPEHK